MKKRWLILLIVFGFLNIQCGSKSKSAKIDIAVTPKSPIVITGDIYNGSKVITASWFSFFVKVSNKSDETVTIVSLDVVVTAVSIRGDFITSSATITASDMAERITCSVDPTTSITPVFTSFGEFAPGDTDKSLYLSYTGTDVTNCLNIPTYTISTVQFFLGNNPTLAAGVADYSYSVQMTPVGWFGTILQPKDRFSKDVFFSTQ